MDNTKESPTVLSLCTGYGGIELGLEAIFGTVTPIAYVEIECYPIANLVAKMESGALVPAPIWTDLKTFNAKIFRGCIDILTGGYPCQPFSQAGRRKGSEDPRHLWPYIKEIVNDCEPRWVFFENVEGHLSNGVLQVLGDLERLGYNPKVGIFSASEVGAPHQRKRIFILGKRIVADSSSWRSRGWESGIEDRMEQWSRPITQEEQTECDIRCETQGCSGELVLGDTKHDGHATTDSEQIGQSETGGMQEPQGRCSELGDTEYNGPLGTKIARSPEETSNHESQGKEKTSKFKGTGRSRISRHLWPARPGEPQFPWEAPRVLADPSRRRQQQCESESEPQNDADKKGE